MQGQRWRGGGQCSAGEPGLLSVCVRWGEGRLHSGSGAAAAGAEKREGEGDKREVRGEDGGREELKKKDASRRRNRCRLESVHTS